ncbi:MAG: aldo/keto reductase [Lachnospiraceae bacterium]|nr:aldo/keto reductase [Oscillospiraceae bacterium]MBR3155062.1 aldo/keto reductase [Lachnospiraceae bacterium]
MKTPGLKLGFGLMRLPKLEDGRIDVEQTAKMVDLFMEAGGTYFDTAYVYDNGGSEEAARKALVERYPRERYTLATKLNAWSQCTDEKSAKQQFYTSLERTGAGYFDYYLLHAFQRNNYTKYDEYHIWDFVKEQKAKGLIKNWGFSFHADPELLEELLNLHPDVDFVQLQVNYADWENPGVNSRRNWEICKAHHKPVIVMEPVKGGILAEPIPELRKLLDDAGRGSYASWAIRFVASQENIHVVLSGMSSLEQMKDNLSYMRDFKPLNEEEQQIIRKAQEILDADKSIACTGCHYCVGGCPMRIPIPRIFAVANRKKGSPHFRTVREYNIVTQGKGRASDCIRCGRCEGSCPQHLPIIDLLENCREMEQ